jgi:hypothetical protein
VRVYCHTFLSLAGERLGNLKSAQTHAQKAIAISPNDQILNRLSAKLKEPTEPLDLWKGPKAA